MRKKREIDDVSTQMQIMFPPISQLLDAAPQCSSCTRCFFFYLEEKWRVNGKSYAQVDLGEKFPDWWCLKYKKNLMFNKRTNFLYGEWNLYHTDLNRLTGRVINTIALSDQNQTVVRAAQGWPSTRLLCFRLFASLPNADATTDECLSFFFSTTERMCCCLAEIEAKEACDWLRAAGFPQYAQLFEGNRGVFPSLLNSYSLL